MTLKSIMRLPRKIYGALAYKGFFSWVPDKPYIKFTYRCYLGKKLNLEDPKTMNEKLQWLKLYNRQPKYTMMADKYAARDYIKQMLGEEYLIPLLGVWDDPKDIDFDSLPEKFVLKCNHNSGLGMCICKDKSKLDIPKVRKELKKGLKQNYYQPGREWPYKNIKRRIIAEQFMADAPGATDFTDYKFFCFNGKVDSVMCCYERNSGDTKFYFFDKNWELKRYNKRGKEAPEGFTMPKPEKMDEMFAVAEKLSADVGAPFLRVDLYNSCGQIYFGELTFFPDSGFDPNILPETDRYFGSLIDLKSLK